MGTAEEEIVHWSGLKRRKYEAAESSSFVVERGDAALAH